MCHRSAALHKSTPSAASESRRCDLTYLTRNKTDSRFRVGPSGLVDDSGLEITARTPTLLGSDRPNGPVVTLTLTHIPGQ